MSKCPVVRFFKSRSKNLFVLPTVLLLNYLVAGVEVLCAYWINSLGVLAQGSHMIFNSLILTSLTASVLVNWRRTRRYSTAPFGLAVPRSDTVTATLLLCNSLILGFLGSRHLIEPPSITYDSLFYLLPLPGLLLDLVTIYVVRHGHRSTEEEKPVLPPRTTTCYSSKVVWHIWANAVGSVCAIVSTVLVQVLSWTMADAVCSIFLASIMFVCSMCLLKESSDYYAAMRRKPSIWTITIM